MANRITPYLDPIMNPGGVQFPVKRGTWDFIEQGWIGQDAAIIQTLIGVSYSSTVVYILYGCVRTDFGGITSFTSGAIFYNGEIYLCPAVPAFATPVNVTANLGQTSWQPTDAVGNQYADPVGFIGSSAANIHMIRTCNFESGASGTGTISNNTASDWGNLVRYVQDWNYVTVFGSGWSTNATTNAKYRKDTNGVVHLSGAANGNAFTTAIFNLPVGFRPIALETFVCSVVDSSSVGTPHSYSVEVRTNGDVIYQYLLSLPSFPGTSPTFLSSISFYAS